MFDYGRGYKAGELSIFYFPITGHWQFYITYFEGDEIDLEK